MTTKATMILRFYAAPWVGCEVEDVHVEWSEDGHSGRGWYAWDSEYPEDGAAHFTTAEALIALPSALAGWALGRIGDLVRGTR